MPDKPNRMVVIGGGLAGGKGAQALREQGFDGELTVVADESELPYERPPLSKDYLQGKSEFADQIVNPAAWYEQNDVDLRTGLAAMSLDVHAHTVGLADGNTLTYDRLLLATGARPRPLDVRGNGDVLYLRSHFDSDVLRGRFTDGARVAVIGGGWIGLEVAAAARNAGCTVTLIESADQPLLGVLGDEMGAMFARLHRDHGVDVRLGAQLRSIDDGELKLADGTIEADVIVGAIGIEPEVSLATMAGLHVDNGVLADAGLRTSNRDVWAVGDVANHDHPVLRQRIRVEHWATALNQPAVAVAGMLGDASARYENLPYFYSDQYDLGMEYVGWAPPGSYERVVTRGDVEGREFVAFWVDGDHHVLAAMNVNVWDVPDAVKPVITERRVVDLDRLADPSVELAEL